MKVLVIDDWDSSIIDNKLLDYSLTQLIIDSLPNEKKSTIEHLGITLRKGEFKVDEVSKGRKIKTKILVGKDPKDGLGGYYRNHKRVLKSFKDTMKDTSYDLVVVSAENLFSDYAPYYSTLHKILEAVDYNHLVFLGIGVEDLKGKKKAKAAFQSVLDDFPIDSIITSDLISEENLSKNFRISCDYTELLDPIITISNYIPSKDYQYYDRIAASFMGLSEYARVEGVDRNDDERMKKYMNEIINSLSDYRNVDIRLFSESKYACDFQKSMMMCCKDDYNGTNLHLVLYPDYYSEINVAELIKEYVSNVITSRLVLTNRKIPCILSLSYDVNCIPICTSQKFNDWYSYYTRRYFSPSEIRDMYINEIKGIIK